MLSIARLAMKGPLAASLSAAIYAILALVFAPFLVITGAIVCLSALRHGDWAGLKVVIFASLASGAVFFLVMHGSSLAIVLSVALVPLLVLAAILRRTKRQGLTLTAAGGFALAYAVFMRLTLENVHAYWAERLTTFSEAVTSQGGRFLEADELSLVAGMMHGSTIVLVMMFLVGSLMLGRWWQSALYNPGGFGTEYRELVLPRPLLPIAAAVSVISLMKVGGTGLSGDVLLVLMVLFALQGLAVVHSRMKQKDLPVAILVATYIFLILLPHILGVVMAFLGIVDQVIDFRRVRTKRLE